MPEIVTRNTKASALTYAEGDNQIGNPSRRFTANQTLDSTHNREVVVFDGANLVCTLTAAATLEAALDVTTAGDIVGYVVHIVNENATTLEITSATNIDGSANDLYIPQYGSITIAYEPVGNQYVTLKRPNEVAVTNSNGNPNISDTEFDIDANITIDTWESVGPTLDEDGTAGSAANIWTALDSVPYGVDWVEIKIRMSVVNNAGSSVALKVYVRETGGAQIIGSDNIVAGFFIAATGATGVQQDVIETGIKVPVDADLRFDMQWTDQATSPSSTDVSMFVTGYGWNR